jgi:hypothetical protein
VKYGTPLVAEGVSIFKTSSTGQHPKITLTFASNQFTADNKISTQQVQFKASTTRDIYHI